MKSIYFPPPTADDEVRATLNGTKTVTRQVAFPGKDLREIPMKGRPSGWWFRGRVYRAWDNAMSAPQGVMSLCRYRPGDILWVRETWTKLWHVDPDGYTHYDQPMYYYAADGTPDITLYDEDGFEQDDQRIRWRPSIHMPREAARIFLRVTDVRVERLQDITEEQARAEGAIDNRHFIHSSDNEYDVLHSAREHFMMIWGSTIKKADRALCGWEANPWVWVIEFERVNREEALTEYG